MRVLLKSGCLWPVDWAVTSDIRDQQFESSHRQSLRDHLLIVNYKEKDLNKTKNDGLEEINILLSSVTIGLRILKQLSTTL